MTGKAPDVVCSRKNTSLLFRMPRVSNSHLKASFALRCPRKLNTQHRQVHRRLHRRQKNIPSSSSSMSSPSIKLIVDFIVDFIVIKHHPVKFIVDVIAAKKTSSSSSSTSSSCSPSLRQVHRHTTTPCTRQHFQKHTSQSS